MILLIGMKNKASFRSGFSILEMLCVIIILGLIAGITVPHFQNTFKSLQLKTTTENLVSLMRYTQDRAITKRIQTRIKFNDDFSQFWLEDRLSSSEGRDVGFQRPKGRAAKVFAIDPSLTLEISEPSLCFYPDGTIDSQRIVLCKNENCYTISTKEQKDRIRMFRGRIQ